MDEQKHKLESLYKLISDTWELPAPEKYGAYAAAKTLVRELREYAVKFKMDRYTREKLGVLDDRVGVVFGLDIGSSHLAAEQYHVECLGEIKILQSEDSFGKL